MGTISLRSEDFALGDGSLLLWAPGIKSRPAVSRGKHLGSHLSSPFVTAAVDETKRHICQASLNAPSSSPLPSKCWDGTHVHDAWLWHPFAPRIFHPKCQSLNTEPVCQEDRLTPGSRIAHSHPPVARIHFTFLMLKATQTKAQPEATGFIHMCWTP